MTETVEIKINLSSNYWEDRYPGARVYVNEELIFDSLIKQPEEINWNGDLNEGDHTITIEMYNKNDGDTVLDDEGNFLKDVILNIDNISIDDIDLEQLLHNNSVYYPKSEFAPEVLEQCVNLGWNGRWELKFDVPTYLWFLENL